MKKSFPFPSLLLAALFLALTGHAQVTIERNEFTRMQGFVDSVFRAVPTGITVPSEGPAQIWDYSSLVKFDLPKAQVFGLRVFDLSGQSTFIMTKQGVAGKNSLLLQRNYSFRNFIS